MSNSYFQFKQFRIEQAQSGMKVTTDGCLFGGWVASEIGKSVEPKRILDIGAGTGLLSLMIAQVTKDANITAVEINKAAFIEATQNFKQSPWADRLECVHTPIQELKDEKFDLIICNPPFFKGSQVGLDVDKNQALHSNSLGVKDLLDHAVRLLNPDGSFYLLYPEREMNEFFKLAQQNELLLQHKVNIRNQGGSGIFRIIASYSLENKTIPKISEIIISDSDRQYTSDTWKLLSPYYQEYNAPTEK